MRNEPEAIERLQLHIGSLDGLSDDLSRLGDELSNLWHELERGEIDTAECIQRLQDLQHEADSLHSEAERGYVDANDLYSELATMPESEQDLADLARLVLDVNRGIADWPDVLRMARNLSGDLVGVEIG